MSELPTPNAGQPTPANAPVPVNAPAAKGTSGLAIAGLVLGIVAILGSWVPILNNVAIIVGVVGVILGVVGLLGIRKGKKTGEGIAISGIVISVLAVVISFAIQFIFVTAVHEATSGPQATSTTQQAQTGDSDKPAAKDDGSADKPAATDSMNLAVGKAATLDNGVTVSLDAVETITDEAGDEYLFATVTYKNDGKEKVDYGSWDWKGTNDAGSETDPTIPILDDRSVRLDDGSLNPGGTVTGKVPLESDTVTVSYYGNIFDDQPTASWKVK